MVCMCVTCIAYLNLTTRFYQKDFMYLSSTKFRVRERSRFTDPNCSKCTYTSSSNSTKYGLFHSHGFFLTLSFEIILETQKSCKDHTEFPYSPHLASLM